MLGFSTWRVGIWYSVGRGLIYSAWGWLIFSVTGFSVPYDGFDKKHAGVWYSACRNLISSEKKLISSLSGFNIQHFKVEYSASQSFNLSVRGLNILRAGVWYSACPSFNSRRDRVWYSMWLVWSSACQGLNLECRSLTFGVSWYDIRRARVLYPAC